ncbi:EXS family-domain-containing protein, partial [Radiomyces spectabilis]|uniref:EXS family-domain-containing protein n=1 Tax=Radiomyces spectabilis TaxID=64574 RepID=UPI00221F0F62
ILASLPAWWRFLQCLRRFRDSDEKIHLANAAKYTSSIVSIWMATLQRIYRNVATLCLCTSLLNSTYTSAWDLKMDWGLLQPHAASFLLRDELVFHRWVYYVAIPINVFLRFSWMWSLFLPKWIPSQCLGFAIALLEVLRRLQWNIFRLENEHLNNCGQYRAIKEIPLPFALTDVKLLDHDEESIGSIPHPVSEGYRTEGLPITRQSSFARESVYGSFYGRRDFENKQDDHLLSSRDPSIFRERLYSSRPASIIDNVVERIRSFGHSSIASYHDDDDDDDDYDDEASAKNFISLK